MKPLPPVHLPAAGSRNFDGIDPLDSRYYDPDIAHYLSERSRIAYQAYMEAALAGTLADFGICTPAIAEEIIIASAKITAEDVYAEEQTTKHDIKAIVNCIKALISNEAKPFVHFGATSYDIIASSNALQLRDATRLVVIPRLKELLKTLIALAEEHADTPQVGRTHGQHAVPITFGYAMAEYVSRLGVTIAALDDLAGQLHGKFSGAVGAYNALSVFVDDPMAFEAAVMESVGLTAAPYATQIVPPEGMVRLIDELGIAAGIMANLAHDMRHLQRTEIAETREKFEKGQTGSSTMAHKRNPWNFENVVSMSKQVTAQIVNANLNLSSEHQRDLTDSASTRFYTIVPASVASMTARLHGIMSKIEVDKAAMARNLALSAGAIAAEPLYLLLEKHGHTAAHEKAKDLAHAALAHGQSLEQAILADKEAAGYWAKFSAREQAIIQTPEQNYRGLAAEKTRIVTASVRQALSL